MLAKPPTYNDDERASKLDNTKREYLSKNIYEDSRESSPSMMSSSRARENAIRMSSNEKVGATNWELSSYSGGRKIDNKDGFGVPHPPTKLVARRIIQDPICLLKKHQTTTNLCRKSGNEARCWEQHQSPMKSRSWPELQQWKNETSRSGNNKRPPPQQNPQARVSDLPNENPFFQLSWGWELYQKGYAEGEYRHAALARNQSRSDDEPTGSFSVALRRLLMGS
ncbi:hypothetical protein Ancab_008436 [Ancistrocladus abbreviatus]